MPYPEVLKLLSDPNNYPDITKANPQLGQALISYFPKRFNFSKFLARGGEAIVILAEDVKMSRAVVLKIALPGQNTKTTRGIYHHFDPDKNTPLTDKQERLAKYKIIESDNEFQERFLRGCDLQLYMNTIVSQKALDFGYIPAIYDKNLQYCYYEMEYISEAEGLLKWILNQDKSEIIKCFYKMLKFVKEVLHDSYVIHTDLKPDNWMVMHNGRVVLLDFGIAKNLQQHSSITKPGQGGIGSPLYASNKQKRAAELREYRDDIYILGKVLHVMWRGHEPHIIADNKIVLDKRKLFPSDILPNKLEQIFLKATSEVDQERYQDIEDFIQDFENILDDYLDPDIDVVQSGLIAQIQSEIAVIKQAQILSMEDQQDLIEILNNLRRKKDERERQNI